MFGEILTTISKIDWYVWVLGAPVVGTDAEQVTETRREDAQSQKTTR